MKTTDLVKTSSRSGTLLGLLAPVLFGFYSLVWRQLDFVTAGELVLYRCLITGAVSILAVACSGQFPQLLQAARTANLWPSVGSALSLVAHWAFFLGAINADLALEASIGLFVAPGATALLATAIYRERVTVPRFLALALATLAMALLLSASDSSFPIWSLGTAITLAIHHCCQKACTRAISDATISSVLEQAILAAGSILWAIFASASQPITIAPLSGLEWVALLLGCGGAVIPSWLYSKAAQHLNASTLGMLGIASPTIQLCLGIAFFGETVEPLQGFAIGLAISAVVIHQFGDFR